MKSVVNVGRATPHISYQVVIGKMLRHTSNDFASGTYFNLYLRLK